MNRPSKNNEVHDALPITRAALKEMSKLALECPLDISRLSYVETQQVLVLYSLIRYFNQFGLPGPIEIDIK